MTCNHGGLRPDDLQTTNLSGSGWIPEVPGPLLVVLFWTYLHGSFEDCEGSSCFSLPSLGVSGVVKRGNIEYNVCYLAYYTREVC